MTQPKDPRITVTKKYFKSNLRVLSENTQRPNTHNNRTPGRKKGGIGKDKINSKITAESLPKCGDCYKLEPQEDQRNLGQTATTKSQRRLYPQIQ